MVLKAKSLISCISLFLFVVFEWYLAMYLDHEFCISVSFLYYSLLLSVYTSICKEYHYLLELTLFKGMKISFRYEIHCLQSALIIENGISSQILNSGWGFLCFIWERYESIFYSENSRAVSVFYLWLSNQSRRRKTEFKLAVHFLQVDIVTSYTWSEWENTLWYHMKLSKISQFI